MRSQEEHPMMLIALASEAFHRPRKRVASPLFLDSMLQFLYPAQNCDQKSRTGESRCGVAMTSLWLQKALLGSRMDRGASLLSQRKSLLKTSVIKLLIVLCRLDCHSDVG